LAHPDYSTGDAEYDSVMIYLEQLRRACCNPTIEPLRAQTVGLWSGCRSDRFVVTLNSIL